MDSFDNSRLRSIFLVCLGPWQVAGFHNSRLSLTPDLLPVSKYCFVFFFLFFFSFFFLERRKCSSIKLGQSMGGSSVSIALWGTEDVVPIYLCHHQNLDYAKLAWLRKRRSHPVRQRSNLLKCQLLRFLTKGKFPNYTGISS